MAQSIMAVLGGVGMFLLGLQMMTSGLRPLVNRRARDALSRFAATPITGMLTGLVTTAAIQSSNATTITTIGLVGTGLLTFPQAIAIIFGANIGTTLTGWMVLLIGFKFKLSVVALPLLLAATVLRMIVRGRWLLVANTVAGFSLMFIGLDAMRSGVTGLDTFLTPANFPSPTFPGLLALVGIGAAATVVTQSSSAGVATTLVLLGVGAVTFSQAAALVIGMDVGTTSGALMASLGGSRAVRRTALAHVFYNLFTAVVAFAILYFAAEWLAGVAQAYGSQYALVMFQSGFNVLGVIVLLPFTRQFAALIERAVPTRPGDVIDTLDHRFLQDPAAAVDLAGAAMTAIARQLFDALASSLRPEGDAAAASEVAGRLRPATGALEDFLGRMHLSSEQVWLNHRYAALLHQFDHVKRLAERAEQSERIAALRRQPLLARPAVLLAGTLAEASVPGQALQQARLARLSGLIDRRMTRYRKTVFERSQNALPDDASIFALTDAMRWLSRVTRHAHDIARYGEIASRASQAAISAEVTDSRPARQ